MYREWQISGDDQWLAKMWPDVKRSIEFAWVSWDPDRDGMMSGPQQCTLDVDLHGWNSFCGSLYQAALLAGEDGPAPLATPRPRPSTDACSSRPEN